MSAELLREAAAKLRERAEAATPGPWESLDNGDRLVAWRMTDDGFDDDFEYVVDEPMSNGDNAAFIATMHPAVGLALADWLEFEADVCVNDDGQNEPVRRSALAVARTILGGES